MTTYRVSGMSCDGCVQAVTRAIKRAVPEVEVTVDLDAGKVDIAGAPDEAAIAKAVTDAGFEFQGTA